MSHDEGRSFTLCSVSISSCHFKDSLSYLFSFLHPQNSFSLPWIISIRQNASKPILNDLTVLKSLLDPIIYYCYRSISPHPSQANFWKNSFTHISSTLSLPVHPSACFFWFLPDGYKNFFLSRPLSTFKLPSLRVSTLLKLQETFQQVAYSQLLQ